MSLPSTMEFRVSQADAFRGWLEEPDADLGWILNALSSNEPSEAMLRGTAFHAALEVARDGEVDRVDSEGFTFLFDTDCQIYLPQIREVRAYKNYGGISITGKADNVAGRFVADTKTTDRFDAERYFASYQWRFYLDIFKADHFRWNVFEMREEEHRVYRVVQLHVLEQFRYPQMESDCRSLAHKLKDFAVEHLGTWAAHETAQPWEAA